MPKWIPRLIIFLILSCLVSYFLEAGFVVAPSVVSILLITFTVIHYGENKVGGIDNPDGELGNPIRQLYFLVGVIVICLALGYFFPAANKLGLYNLGKF